MTRRPVLRAIHRQVVVVWAIAAVVGIGGTGDAVGSVPAASGTSVVPPQVRLPNEGEPSADVDTTGWTTDDSLARPWLLDPCRPTAYPTDARRSGFRTVSRTGPELFQARQLAVYPTPAVASEAMDGFRRVLTACQLNRRDEYGGQLRWTTDVDVPVGDEAIMAASSLETMPGGDRITVTRVGPMVFLAYDTGHYLTAELDRGALATRRVAEQFVDSL